MALVRPARRRSRSALASPWTSTTRPRSDPLGFSVPSTASTPTWQPYDSERAAWGSSWQSGRAEWRHSEFKVDLRNWKSAPLDLEVKPEGFLAWHDRALGLLSGNRLDVRRLLLWAGQSTVPLDTASERKGAHSVGLVDDVAAVSLALLEAIKHLLADSLLGRARTCGDSGLELWRRLAAEWRGNAPQVLAAKSRRFNAPTRCASMAKLWEALPLWEQLGRELAASGLAIPDLLRAQALENLVPDTLLQAIVSRPELANFEPKLRWVKAQM